MRLLLVDDEEIIVTGLKSIILEMETCFTDIETALNAEQALVTMRFQRVDFLLTDIAMPGMNGLELAELAHKNKLCGHYAILSGHNDFELVRDALRNKAIDYLLKPVDEEELAHLLQRAYALIVSNARSDDQKPAVSGNAYMQASMEYIERNYQNQISLDLLAGQIGLHPNYLSRVFVREAGMPFVRYVVAFRIQKAQEYILKHPDCSVEEAAQASGFVEQRQFFKNFKSITGMTPGEFKRAATK